MKILLLQDKRIIGSALLIAGCCIGAGMLGLPITTGLVGFFPSIIILFAAWGFMFSTSKLLIEANSWFPKQEINLITLAGKILGKSGQILVWGLFLMLFYSLLAAYFIKGGDILYSTLLISLPYASPATGTAILFIVSLVVLNCKLSILDRANYIFMIILFLSFCLLLQQSLDHADIKNLSHQSYDGVIFLFPFLIIAFGYHNLIPSIRNYLEQDDLKLSKAIYYGSIIPLIIYTIWICAMLSIIPLNGEYSITSSFAKNQIATEPLSAITGSGLVHISAMLFSFAAIITSIFGQGLSLVDFFTDGLSLPKKHRFAASLLAMLPPYAIIQFNPDIFFTCLGLAGGVAAALLYGFLPALIVYRGRYIHNLQSDYVSFKSKSSLFIIMAISLAVMLLELMRSFGLWGF